MLQTSSFPSDVLFSDGNHNAFPSVCRFRNRLYLAFRSGMQHLTFDGAIRLLVSEDEGTHWKELKMFRSTGDLRDPRLAEIAGELHLFSGMRTPLTGKLWRVETRHWISSDGINFREEQLAGLHPGTFLWNIVSRNHLHIGAGYLHDLQSGSQLASLYRSNDGCRWEWWCDLQTPGNETALAFAEDGTLCGIIRNETPPCFLPTFFSIFPDGRTEYHPMKLPLQGVMLRTINAQQFLVASRRWDSPGRRNLRCELFRCDRNGELLPQAVLPSGGDCSYATAVERNDGKLLLIYYSSHRHSASAETTHDTEHTLPADLFQTLLSCDNGSVFHDAVTDTSRSLPQLQLP